MSQLYGVWNRLWAAALDYPLTAIFLLGIALYLSRLELTVWRLSIVEPALVSIRDASRLNWHMARLHIYFAGRRWNEITLFTERDAPSRFAFGIIGGTMLLIAMTSSYLVLHPAILNIDALVNLPERSGMGGGWVNTGLAWLGTPDMQTAYIVLFDSFVGFVCLELVGITNTLRFHRRYGRAPSIFVGCMLFLGLFGFAFYEAKLTTFSNTISMSRVCAEQTADQQNCPPRNPRSDPKPSIGEMVNYEVARAKAGVISDKMPIEFAIAMAMPLILMIVGLAFDFFEELYLPASSGVSAMARASAAVLAAMVWMSSVFAFFVFVLLYRLLSHPVALVILLATALAHEIF